ncbi:MAG TPA: PEP-CTERM sorting domain-containing protein, partial [Isosphaeraceae bacterium]|nr:PEP-CTERM sorting domain-containing protein [Isosphaeraceae bacterium]
SLMFSSSNDISYNLSASDLDLLKPVPEGTFITISNGRDVTGYFPSDVLFQNVDTGMLFSGSLVSAGQISITSVPEPCSLVLMTIGGLGLVGCGWRRPKQAA